MNPTLFKNLKQLDFVWRFRQIHQVHVKLSSFLRVFILRNKLFQDFRFQIRSLNSEKEDYWSNIRILTRLVVGARCGKAVQDS